MKHFLGMLLLLIDVISSQNIDELSNATLARQSPPDDQSPPKLCNDDKGECVQYYLCQNGQFVTDGANLLDIRLDDEDECNDIFLTCCSSGALDLTQPPPGRDMINSKCGFRNKNGLGFQITGSSDNETEFGEFPWMLAVLNEESVGEQIVSLFQCGASLITERVALTAAHCVFNKTFSLLKVRAGEWDTSTDQETFPYAEYKVQDIAIHENFNQANLRNDIALLFLDEPAKIAENVNTVCLPPQDYNFDGDRCFVAGWGKDMFGKEGKYQNILKKIEVPVVPFARCQDELRRTRLGKRFVLDASFMCAGGEIKDACKGDGGGPMVCEIDGHPSHYYQAGIVAWGIGCNTASPGVYVDVAKFRSWIETKIHARNLPTLGFVI